MLPAANYSMDGGLTIKKVGNLYKTHKVKGC